MGTVRFQIIEFQGPHYEEFVTLRDRILRRPLGLTFSSEYLAQEAKDLLIVGFIDERMVCCAILSPSAKKEWKMRQVAVDDGLQGQGIGAALLTFVDQLAQEEGIKRIFAHVRAVAQKFYQKHGYQVYGEPFEEVSILHYAMDKRY